jgi:hypothetical protein
MALRGVTYEGNTRVAAASLLNAEQHAGEAAQAIFSQTRYVNAVAASDAQALVRGVAAGASGAVEEKEMGGGREHAARAGHVAVAADDGDARHPDPTKPTVVPLSLTAFGLRCGVAEEGVRRACAAPCRSKKNAKIN